MATKSKLTSLLRAAASRCYANTLLHPHDNLLRHHHTSPTSFLHHHPPNPHLLSNLLRHHHTSPTSFLHHHPLNPHLLSTSISRRVHTRATAVENPRSPYSVWPYALALGCIATGGMVVFYKFREKTLVPKMNGTYITTYEPDLRFQGSIPHMYRKGHSVVVEGSFKKIAENDNSNAVAKNVTAWELNFLATEALADQPRQLTAALDRNNKIFAHKQKVAEEDREKNVSKNKKEQNVLEEEQKDAVSWGTAQSNEISESCVDLAKSKSEGMVNQLALSPLPPDFVLVITGMLKLTLDMFQDLPHLLQEGQSVFIKGFYKVTDNEMKEDESDAIKEDKSAEMKKYESAEMKKDELDEMKEDKWAKSVMYKGEEFEYHFLAEVVAKYDERYMLPEVDAATEWNTAE